MTCSRFAGTYLLGRIARNGNKSCRLYCNQYFLTAVFSVSLSKAEALRSRFDTVKAPTHLGSLTTRLWSVAVGSGHIQPLGY